MASILAVIASAISYSFEKVHVGGGKFSEGVTLSGRLGSLRVWDCGMVETIPVPVDGYTNAEWLDRAQAFAGEWLRKTA